MWSFPRTSTDHTGAACNPMPQALHCVLLPLLLDTWRIKPGLCQILHLLHDTLVITATMLSNYIMSQMQLTKNKTRRQEVINRKIWVLSNKATLKYQLTFQKKKTLQARREWQNKFKVRKGKNLQSRLLYPAMISLRFDGEIKNFTDKQKLREFSISKSALQQMLQKLL